MKFILRLLEVSLEFKGAVWRMAEAFQTRESKQWIEEEHVSPLGPLSKMRKCLAQEQNTLTDKTAFETPFNLSPEERERKTIL